MAGYCDYSKSNNAVRAENDERYPLSKAKRVLAIKLGWTQTKAEQFLKNMGSTEWHHSSKHYNIVDYYDVSDDFIRDYRDEIDDFIYKTPEKKQKINVFKCWNKNKHRSDARLWDWKITSRWSNNCFSLEEIRDEVETLRVMYNSLKVPTHKTQLRIYRENLAAVKKILNAINEIEK